MNNLTITYSAGVHHVVTSPLYQGDYGQQITFAGIADLPASFEVHFSNEASKGISTRSIGLDSVVDIPNIYLQTGGGSIYGWVFLHDPATSGETEYTFRIPVNRKPVTEPVVPTPPQEDVIAQAINAINGSAEDAAQSATDAQTAQGLAEDARDAAQTAQGLAETAQGKAEDAQEAAETAQGKAETAQGKAEDAQTAAEAQAVLAESYAKGGTNTRTGENTDNAKYYAEQSAGSASTASGYVTDAQGYASDASGYANDAKDYKNAAGDYATEAYGYKNDASGSASEASGYANDAKGYKNDASGYASDASGYATAASGSATSAEAEALKAEGYAINKQNGENVGAGSPYYHNSAKYFASQAQNHAGDAGTEALKAEGFAVGKQNGSAVSSGSPYYQNNAEYYAGQAAASATSAAESAATFETDTTLTVSGKAADAKATGDEITDLKSHNNQKWQKLGTDFAVYKTDNQCILDELEIGYVTADGSQSSSSSYFHTGFIPVSSGDVITFYTFGGPAMTGRTAVGARFLAAYDSDKKVVSASGSSTTINSYTVPNGIAFIICSFAIAYRSLHPYISKNSVPTAYETGYALRYVDKAQSGRHYYKYKCDTSFYNETFELPTMSLCKNVVYAFSGYLSNIGTDPKLSIGQGTNHYGASWIEIDSENVYWHLYTSSESTYTYAHGLPFDTVTTGQISISLIVNDNTKATLKIEYGETEYTKTLGFYGFSDQPFYVKDTGLTIERSVFSVTCKDFDAPVFVFGDSYTAIIESTSKWTHYVVDNGFGNNFCINAFPGADSSELASAFANTIKIATPEKILWCVGMNDGSDTDASTPNAQWLTYVTNMINVCKAKGIEPLFVTIPTVPSVNNEGKNAWIKASGYRFADFATAVGATSSGAWNTGMLSPDNVHPSEYGAKAMYFQLLADLPDLFV